jgi:hypothetical protein
MPTTIFTDSFETDNLSAWSGTALQSPATIAASSTHAHDGTYSVKAIVPSDNTWAMVYKDITGTSTVYWQAYVYIDSQSVPSGGIAKFMEVLNGWNPVARFGIKNNSGTLRYSLSYGDGNGNETFTIDTSDTVDLGNWHCIQIAAYANSSTGWTKLWIDGSLKINNSNVNRVQQSTELTLECPTQPQQHTSTA